MAWTTPRTWIAGEEVTAALLNAQIRDNLLETMAAKATTAQDLFQGTAANAVARIAIGSVGQVFQVLTSSTIGWGAAPASTTFPAGTIIFHTDGVCPPGWAEVMAARGRILVGLPAGGTLAGTVGSALTDLATRTITANPAHTHTVGTLSWSTPANHTHTYSIDAGGGAVNSLDVSSAGSFYGFFTTSSDGAHTHTVSGSSGSTGAASVDVTMPYIQYIVCQKS